MNTLAQRSILMRFSAGMPGTSRKDKRTTAEVKVEKSLGEHAGKWIADLYPSNAMEAISEAISAARAYHYDHTLPFVSNDDTESTPVESEEKKSPRRTTGIGILPAALIKEYTDFMRTKRSEIEALVESTFLADPKQWVDWAKVQHNGTFEPKNYPGCSRDSFGNISFDAEKFREVMRKKFYLRTEPLPVPEAKHFEDTVASLLGTDTESVNLRVRDAEVEAQRELLKRMIAPVQAMAQKLNEQPKGQCKDIRFRDSLVGNIAQIVELGPKLNLSGDPAIDSFINEMKGLTQYTPDKLRDDKDSRTEAAKKAEDLTKRLSGYQF